ncbi:MAG: TonB-dependent receptor [Novosphingobium sp.]|nr:TonB-dependent receptor [Novosphingobium sp.]
MKKSPNISTFAAIFATISALPVPALADDGSDSDIIVTASIDDPAQGAAGGVRTLGAEDLQAASPVSLLESLALLPGIDAFEKGGPGGGSYLAIRGGEPNFTLVTINGVRVNDPMVSSGGGFDFSLIDASDATRVDVLSGPWSTAYGADALSGVVSLRLNEPGESRASMRAGIGSGGRWELGGSGTLTGGAGSLTFAASARDTGDLLEGSNNRGLSTMIAASPRVGNGASLDLFGYYARSEGSGGPEDSGGPELAVIRDLEKREREQIVLGATVAAELASSLTGQVRAGWSRSTLVSASPGIASGTLDGIPPIDSDSRFDRFEAVASLDWSPSPALALGVGGSLVQEDGTSDGVVDFGFPIPTAFSLSRTLPGLFATASLTLPRDIELRAGLRADFPENDKTRFTPRAGVMVPLGQSGLRLTASYAQGFKQPSLYALGFPLIANPDLLPERSRTLDAGVEWASPNKAWTASATAYRSVYRDLIDFDPELFTNVNRNKVTAKGIELAASGRTGPIRAIASLTWLDTQSADGAQLRFRPEWKGAAAVEWQASQMLSLRLDGRFTGSYFDSSVPTGFVRMPGFATFDAQAGLALGHGLEVRAALRNLADKTYSRTIGTPEPGRTVFVSLHGSL